MSLQLASESRAALDTQYTMRCVLKCEYSKSRRGSEVIEWSKIATQEVKIALASALDQESSELSWSPIAINLARSKVFVCFDIFTRGHETATIDEASVSYARPIHVIWKEGEDFVVQRERRLDSFVAQEIKRQRSLDLGPRPYFRDELNPPIYDNGKRVDATMEEYFPGWRWEDSRIFGSIARREQQHTDGDGGNIEHDNDEGSEDEYEDDDAHGYDG